MRAFLAHDRLQLLFVALGVATCTWRGLAVAALIAAVVVCRRLVRRRLPVWFAEASTPAAGSAGVTVAPDQRAPSVP